MNDENSWHLLTIHIDGVHQQDCWVKSEWMKKFYVILEEIDTENILQIK